MMTNAEYEAACVTATKCYDRFEGEHKLKQWDEHIATMEAALEKAHEARREIVNFYNLNKHECQECHHIPDQDLDGVCRCIECGVAL